jgi:flagellar motor switch protein FliN/FliY
MPDETPEETPDEADVEAEMLRMMQEEAEGGEGEAGEDDALAALQEAAGEGGGEDEGSDIDNMLEQEMLRAMEQEGSEGEGSAVAPFVSQLPGVPESVEGIDRLAEIDVEVTVELGENQIPIQDILSWGPDSVVELGAFEHEPVDVLVNGKLFARGEVVVVGDTFGVRIIELVNQPDEHSP